MAIAVFTVWAVGIVAPWVALERPAEETGRQESSAAAMEAATDYTELFMTYEYSQIDTWIDEVLSVSAGEFSTEFTDGAEQLRASVVDTRATSSCDVIAIAVSDLEPEVEGDWPRAVEFIAFADATLTNDHIDGERVNQYRVQLTLVAVDGQWKMAKVDLR